MEGQDPTAEPGRIVTFKSKLADGSMKTVQFTAKKKIKKTRLYTDNAKNRSLNRVGEPIPMTPAMIEWSEKVKSGQVKRDDKGRILKGGNDHK